MCPVSEIILMKELIQMHHYWKYVAEGQLGEQNHPLTLSHWKDWFLLGGCCCVFCFVLWSLFFAEFGDSRQEKIKCNSHKDAK